MSERFEKTAGALLGVHTGDALGATVEFMPWAAIRDRYPHGLHEIVGGGPFGWPPGHATDDTDLTRAVLLAYLEPTGDPVHAAADHMVDWISGRWPGREPGSAPRDVGRATAVGLGRYSDTGDPRQSGAGVGQAGNGSLMRCIPTALAVADRSDRIRHSVEISAITHDDPRCTASCAAYNEMAATLVAGGTPADAVESGLAVAVELDPDAADAIRYGRQLNVPTMAESGVIELADEGAGFVLDSLSIAVAAVLDERPFRAVLADVVRLGRDTDTNGAIAGGLLGARDGASAIPDEWRRTLQFGEEFEAAARAVSGF